MNESNTYLFIPFPFITNATYTVVHIFELQRKKWGINELQSKEMFPHSKSTPNNSPWFIYLHKVILFWQNVVSFQVLSIENKMPFPLHPRPSVQNHRKKMCGFAPKKTQHLYLECNSISLSNKCRPFLQQTQLALVVLHGSILLL